MSHVSVSWVSDKVGADTLLSQIVHMVAQAQRSRAPIQALADKVSAWFVPSVIAIAVITAIAWFVWGPQPALAYAIANAVAAPSGRALPFATPSWSMGAGDDWCSRQSTAFCRQSYRTSTVQAGCVRDRVVRPSTRWRSRLQGSGVPNPVAPITTVVADLGVDNIQAQAASVPDRGATAMMLPPLLVAASCINCRLERPAVRP